MMAAPAPAALPQLPLALLTLAERMLLHDERLRLRLQSSAWGLLAALTAGLAAAALAAGGGGGPAPPPALETSLRAAGCGFFYGLLAFHLQRVDPDDGHLQAGLVGAVCGIRSLSAGPVLGASLAPSLMMECARAWLPLWLPLIGSALLVQGTHRLLAARAGSAASRTGPHPTGSPGTSSPQAGSPRLNDPASTRPEPRP